jgi:hypothetical protein
LSRGIDRVEEVWKMSAYITDARWVSAGPHLGMDWFAAEIAGKLTIETGFGETEGTFSAWTERSVKGVNGIQISGWSGYSYDPEEGGEYKSGQTLTPSVTLGPGIGAKSAEVIWAQEYWPPGGGMYDGSGYIYEGVKADIAIDTEWGKTEGSLSSMTWREIKVTNGLQVREWGRVKYEGKGGNVTYLRWIPSTTTTLD